MYRAVAESDGAFDGVFLVAVKTTKIFCRPSCPARTPLMKNVEFFAEPREAVYAGYRPCKRCKPLEGAKETPAWVTKALALATGDERLTEYGLRKQGIPPERLRRWFQRHHGMTFHSYQRGLRLGKAMQEIKNGKSVTEASAFSGWDSPSGFRDAFQKAFGVSPSKAGGPHFLVGRIETPLGAMLVVSDDDRLYLLEFSDRRMIATQMQVLQKRYGCSLSPGTTKVAEETERQLNEYFAGTRQQFDLPVDAKGTDFQQAVWKRLQEIPYGKTMSYGDLASELGAENAQRAVGKANGDNRIAIVVPCHRVVRSDGTLCGYGGGLWRKQRLLELEQGQLALL